MEIINELARRTFFTMYRNEAVNVEIERIKQAIEENRIVPEALEHIKASSLLEDLGNDPLCFSNDFTCDLVAQLLFTNTQHMKLKQTLSSVYIGYVENEEKLPNPHVLSPFYDGSRLIIIDSSTTYHLDQICELISIKYMREYGHLDKHSQDFDENFVEKYFLKSKNPYSLEHLNEYESFIMTKGGKSLSDDFAELQSKIYEVALGFVIAHELGHCYLGHTGYSNNKETNYGMEIEADECATFILREYLKYHWELIDRKHIGLQLCGIAATMISMAQRSSLNLHSPMEDGEKHPSVRFRYVCALFNIQHLFGKKHAVEVASVVNWFCDNMNFYPWEENWWILPVNIFDNFEMLKDQYE